MQHLQQQGKEHKECNYVNLYIYIENFIVQALSYVYIFLIFTFSPQIQCAAVCDAVLPARDLQPQHRFSDWSAALGRKEIHFR